MFFGLLLALFSGAQTLILLSIFAQAAENCMQFPRRRQIRFSRFSRFSPDLREATKGAKYRNTFGGRHKLWPRPQVIKYQAACSRQMEMERGPWCLVFGFSGFGFGLWPLALSNFA